MLKVVQKSRLFTTLLLSMSLLMVIPVNAGDSGRTLIIHPTDLTLRANLTGGEFPSSIWKLEGDALNVSETCWTYTLANNTTWCNQNAWSFDFWFELNSKVPRFKNAKIYMTVWRTGDNEQVRFKWYNWHNGMWIVTGFNIGSEPQEKMIGMSNMGHSPLFGSMRFGFVDFADDSTNTTLHFDRVWMEVRV